MDPPKRPPPPPASFVPSAPFHGAAASIDLRKQAISASAVKSQNWGLEALVEEAAAAAGCTPHVTSSRGAAGGGTPDWSAYWDGKHTVELPDRLVTDALGALERLSTQVVITPPSRPPAFRRHGRFNVYTAGSTGPVVLCIHGGGYTGLTWSLVAPLLKSK